MELSPDFLSLNASIILGAITFLLAFYFVFLRSKPSSEKNLPPLASGSLPIFGHLHLLAGSQPPHVTLGNMADKHGPIFTIKLGQFRAIILSQWDLAKECYTTHDLLMLSRPDSLVANLMSNDFAMFGFSPYGPYWREIRKLISSELLSTRRLELLKATRLSEFEISSKELYTFSSSNKNAVLDVRQWFENQTLNTVLRMVAGKRFFGGAVDRGSEGQEARRVQRIMKEFFHFSGLFLPADSFPILRHIDIGGYQKQMKAISAEMDELIEEWFKEHLQNRKSNKSADNDFMDVMMSMLEQVRIDGKYDPDTIIKSTCTTLISAATDTTSASLSWALAHVMNNPQILKKVKEELDLHVGKDRRITDADIPKLAYLQAIVKETLRLSPPGPMGGPRKLTEDAIIGGYHVPKGTRVIFNMWKLHRDPNVWTDEPTKFKPERFLTTHKDFDVKGHNFELIPFSAGRRSCPGMYFALQMLHLILGNLFHAFDLEIAGGGKIELKESPGLTNHLDVPLELVVTPRLSADLY